MMVHNINKQMNSIAHITEHDSAYGSPQSQWFTSSGYQAASQHMPVEETATAAGELDGIEGRSQTAPT